VNAYKKDSIRLFHPDIGEDELEALRKVFASGWIGLGEETAQFENEFSRYLKIPYVVGLNSCTSALDMSLRMLDIAQGDEIIVPTVTFVSTAHAVLYNRATPIFADICPDTMQIDPDDIERKISTRTKAIIVVHYGGRPVDFDSILSISQDIPIIEDAAHACGATYKGTKCGALGSMGCFSFHAVKNLSMGDGGALTLNHAHHAERAKKLRWLGIDKGTWDRTDYDMKYWWEYQVEEIGLKCHMNDIQASIGRVQLRKLDENNRFRKQIAEMYHERLGDVPWISMPHQDDAAFSSSWHLFCIRTGKDRNRLSLHLQKNGISAGVHYKPLHLYKCYGSSPVLPKAEETFQEILSLPIHLKLTNDDIDYICEKIREFD